MSSSNGAHGPTIYDVARHAGVSASTVSRVLNGISGESSGLAERVRASATTLRFVPNRTAVSLSRRRTRTVGVLVPDLENPSFQLILRGIEERAASEEYNVLVASSGEDLTREVSIAERLRRSSDAVILCSPRMPRARLEKLATTLSPVVVVGRDGTGTLLSSVGADNYGGITAMAEYLVGLGHRHLLYLRGHPQSAASLEREVGLRDFVTRHSFIRLDLLACGVTFTSGAAARDAVRTSKASAVLAFNDLVATGLMSALTEGGTSVPSAVSVAGFDDILFAGHTSPKLTTVRVPYRDIGARAWDHTAGQLDGRTEPERIVLPCKLVVRESTTAPAAAAIDLA